MQNSLTQERSFLRNYFLAIPEVKVTPRFQAKRLKEEANIRCHVAGEPLPQVQWLKNDEALNHDQPDKYDIIGNGTKLIIKNVDYADTGAYMCQASSIGGVTRDISSLVVQEQPTPSKSFVTCMYKPVLLLYVNIKQKLNSLSVWDI